MQPIERLLDLAAFLTASARPVPMSEIYEAFASEYVGSDETRERKFSRDKEELRRLGLPLEYVDEDEGAGYRVDRSVMYLPDLKLNPDERAALFATGAAAQRAGLPMAGERAHALAKLWSQGPGESRASRVPVVAGASHRELEETLLEASAHRHRVKVTYGHASEERLVDPYAVVARRGRLTLIGHCHLRGGVRAFHADKMRSCERASANAKGPEFDVPAEFTPETYLPRFPWQLPLHEPIHVTLAFAPELAEAGPQQLGIAPGEDCPATNLDGLIGQVLAMGPGVRISGPPEALARVRTLLAELSAEAR